MDYELNGAEIVDLYVEYLLDLQFPYDLFCFHVEQKELLCANNEAIFLVSDFLLYLDEVYQVKVL